MTQKDVARRFKVTETLVSDLVRESRKKPEKLREKKRFSGFSLVEGFTRGFREG